MRRFLIALLLLITLLLPVLLWVSHRIGRIAEEAALQTLTVATLQLKRDILTSVEWFGERLRIITLLLIESGEALDSPATRKLLARLSQQQTPPVGQLRILLPDGRTVTPEGVRPASPETRAAFEEDARRGSCLSPLEPDPDGDGKIVRYSVPIVSGQETLGLLVAVGSSERMPQFLRLQNMSKDYQIYLIEGKSGEFLVDTWHERLGNIRDYRRQTRTGYASWKQMHEHVFEEKAGTTIFTSKNAGELFYIHYEPLHFNSYVVGLSLPENVVMRDANAVKKYLFSLQLFAVAVFAVFLFWTLFDAIRENRRKSGQLLLARQALGLEKQLAAAHREPAIMRDALKTVARILTAEHCSFLLFREDKPWKLYSSDPSYDVSSIPDMPALRRILLEKKSLHFDVENMGEPLPEDERQRLRRMGIHSIMLCLVEDPKDGVLSGTLYAVNMRQRRSDTETLDLVAHSFATTLTNISTRMKLKEKSELDTLTGLRNRNCFEADLAACAARPMRALTCVYADANGLRELNNNHGHEAGDRMLRYVARALAETFGTETAYRIGGDEFAAVVPDLEEDVARRKLENFQRIVAEQGYACSAGLASSLWPADIPVLLKAAEKRMYADKRRYYAAQGKERREKAYGFPGQ